ncbi:MAG: AbrB/MazE/SpoVT family DNA-binding domain-containing protein [Chloroflexota bacterium]
MNARLSQKGWVVIPAALRKKYGLKPGGEVRVVDYGGVLSIVPVLPYPIHAGAGLLRGDDSLTQAIVEEHQQERQDDEARPGAG